MLSFDDILLEDEWRGGGLLRCGIELEYFQRGREFQYLLPENANILSSDITDSLATKGGYCCPLLPASWLLIVSAHAIQPYLSLKQGDD